MRRKKIIQGSLQFVKLAAASGASFRSRNWQQAD